KAAGHQGRLSGMDLERPRPPSGVGGAVQRAVQFGSTPRVRWKAYRLFGHEPGDLAARTPEKRRRAYPLWRKYAAGPSGGGRKECDTFVTEKVTHKSANNRIGNWKGVPEKTWRTNIPIGGMTG